MKALAATLLALAGCAPMAVDADGAAAIGNIADAPATAPAGSSGDVAMMDSPAATCDAATLGDLVGRPRSDGLRAVALKRSGASVVRWLPPGTITTMDYRRDRLNIELSEAGRVTRLRCG